MPDCSAIVSISPVWPEKGLVPINPSLQRFRTTNFTTTDSQIYRLVLHIRARSSYLGRFMEYVVRSRLAATITLPAKLPL